MSRFSCSPPEVIVADQVVSQLFVDRYQERGFDYRQPVRYVCFDHIVLMSNDEAIRGYKVNHGNRYTSSK